MATSIFFVIVILVVNVESLFDEFSVSHDVNIREEDNVNIRDELDCDELLRKYAISASNFTLCSLNFSHPIRVCESCYIQYYEFMDRYSAITTTVNGTSCKSVLLSANRLGIVEIHHQNLKMIWNRGYCDKCLIFSNGSSPSISKETKIFFDYYWKTETCIENNKKINNTDNGICINCMKDYLTLNSYYESLKSSSEVMGICMDIVDSMNTTRSMWSSTLKCCKLRQTPEVIFLVCTAFFSLLPVILYVSARYFSQGARTKVMEQNRLYETFPQSLQESDELNSS